MTFIQRLLETVDAQADDGNRDYCLLLESKLDSDRWIQLTWDSINAAYPFEEEPLAKLRETGVPVYPDCEVISWMPNLFATFARQPENPRDQLADFLAEYFRKILETSPAENDLRIEEQQL